MQSELLQLNRIRLERDLSYGRLASLIGLKRQTLFRLLSQDGCTPHDRTLYKIKKFLDTRGAASARTERVQ